MERNTVNTKGYNILLNSYSETLKTCKMRNAKKEIKMIITIALRYGKVLMARWEVRIKVNNTFKFLKDYCFSRLYSKLLIIAKDDFKSNNSIHYSTFL